MLFWLLKFLPALLIHGFMGLAIVAFAISFVPLVPYKIFLKWGGIIAIALGLFLEGATLTQQAWESQVADLQKQIAASEAKVPEINTQVVEKLITQTKTIHEKGDQVVQYVDREVTKYDNTCTIPDVVIKALNAAALNQIVDEQPLTPTTMIDTKPFNTAAAPK